MSCQLETARLTLRPWTESDIGAHRGLVAERGDGMPSIERDRRMIEDERVASARTGIALLAVVRRDVGDFIGYCGLTVRTGRPEADGSRHSAQVGEVVT